MDNAKRLIQVLGNRSRYLVDQEEWMHWNGSRWIEKGRLSIRHELKEVARYWKAKVEEYRNSEDKFRLKPQNRACKLIMQILIEIPSI